MSTAPYVNFKTQATDNIESTPTIIFGNDQHNCLIDSVLITNLSDQNEITVRLYMAREVTIGTDTDFLIAKNIVVKDNLNFEEIPWIFEPGDLLYANSYDYQSTFNTLVSYLELTQQPPITIVPIEP